MAKQTIGIGAVANDGTGDTIRDAFDKANDNFTELYNTDATLGTASTLASDTDGTLAANSDAKVATQKATKTYIDAKVAGLSWKQAVRAATTANGTLATAYENGDTIDGVVLATGDRILLKNQTSGSENGIYIVAASGAPTRATDADNGAELVNASVYVSEGTTLADTQWTCTTNATITVNTTSLAFAQLTSGGSSITAKDEGSTLTSAMTSIDFVGSGVVATNSSGAVTVTVSGGGSATYRMTFGPYDNEPPSSNNATQDTRNQHPCLDFDGTTSESSAFSDVLSSGYAGAGLTVKLFIGATSATSGDCKFEASFERMNTDLDADSFATAKNVTITVSGTSGILTSGTITFSNSEIDGLSAGEPYRLKVTRLPADAADTVASDIELYLVQVAE